jgi:hypothetical protein
MHATAELSMTASLGIGCRWVGIAT